MLAAANRAGTACRQIAANACAPLDENNRRINPFESAAAWRN